MNDFLVFNHHSLPFAHKNDAEKSMPIFLKICISCKNIGLHTILVDETVDASWFRLKLADGYYWQDWYNQLNDDSQKDLARAFRSIQTNQPFFTLDDINKHVELYEVLFLNDTFYSALKAAAWNNAPVASFPSTETWRNSFLPVTIRTIDQNDEIKEKQHKITNLHSISIFEELKHSFLSMRNESIRSCCDVYNNWNGYFPFLNHCGKVQEQLTHWSAGETLLSQVVESLTILNSFSEKWSQGEIETFSYEELRKQGLNHKASGESDSVKNNASLRKQRKFWLPNGVKRFFESHIKLSQGYRIHFFPDSATRSIFIGYIGKHLKL